MQANNLIRGKLLKDKVHKRGVHIRRSISGPRFLREWVGEQGGKSDEIRNTTEGSAKAPQMREKKIGR